MLTRRELLQGAAASGLALAAPHVARAEGVVLRLSQWAPPHETVRYHVLGPWAEMVAEMTDGRVRIVDAEEPLGPPPGHFERLQSGAAEVACSLHGYAGQGAFPRARLGQLSCLGDSYGASPVFADIYMNDLAGAAEHEGIKLLGVFEHGPGQLFLRDRAIASPQDFKGLRIRNPGGYIASLLTDLGVEAVSTPVERVAPALESGEIDGAAFPYSAIQAFGVLGKFDHALELPGGFYNASWYFGINGARWQAIEARDRQAIDSIAGPLIAELAGKAFDDADHVARESCRAAGVNIYRASEEVEAFVRQAGSRHEQQWIDHVTAEGFEGDYLLGKLRRRTMVDRL